MNGATRSLPYKANANPEGPIPGGAASIVTTRYEALRAAVLSGAAGGVRRGLALLARRGMAAWAAQTDQVSDVPGPGAGPQRAPGPLPAPCADMLVEILAGMVLAHHRPP